MTISKEDMINDFANAIISNKVFKDYIEDSVSKEIEKIEDNIDNIEHDIDMLKVDAEQTHREMRYRLDMLEVNADKDFEV